MGRVLHVDVETCCVADLRRIGADVYSRDPSLIVTVLAWAFDDMAVQSLTLPERLPLLIEDHLRNGGRFSAWNAAFEWAILTNHYGLALKPEQAVCCMQKALHSGLPAALADAGPAIGARIVKDATAHRLMMQMSKPRKAGGYWHDDEAKLEALRTYCERDVESERGISRLIAPLPPQEAQVSALDRAANERGVRIDLDLVAALKDLAVTEIHELDRECAELTRGAVTRPGTQTARLQAWLTARGVDVPDLGKETVGELLKGSWSPSAQRVLEIRQEVARSSVKKLDAMQRCVGPDDRVRGQLAYYGAFRTGRWAGRLIQPQNLPRPAIKDVGSFIRHASSAGLPDPDWVRQTWGPPLQAIASALRGCLIPGPGKAFAVYDLSQIEARVVAWLAGQRDVLGAFARGEPVYEKAAAAVGSGNRQLGKALTLACGFQQGGAKFQETAAKPPYNVMLTLEQAQGYVAAWRTNNPKIVELWWAADKAVKTLLALDYPFARPIAPKLAAQTHLARNGQPLLTLTLPSGRRLYYRNPRLEPGLKGRPEIVYDGVDQITKRWGPVRTYGGKLVENMVQAVARDAIVEAALRVDRLRLGELVLSVHDELVFEVPLEERHARATAIGREIDRRPEWAADLPVASEGGVRERYGK